MISNVTGKVNRVSEERDGRRECAEGPGSGSRVSHPGRYTPRRRLAWVAWRHDQSM